MLTLFLADDEKWILEGLKASIDWENEGYSIVGTAQTGPDTVAGIINTRPDLALVDIRMPGFDGLTVIRRLKELNISTRFVIISGYAEFEYARTGIELNISGYLLKPVDEEKLLSVARSVREAVLSDRGHAGKAQTHAAPEGITPAEYIAKYCAEDLSFDALCAAFAKSPTAMRTSLLNDVGMSFSQYLTKARMERAAQLLADTDCPIAAVASSCGYEDHLYFRKVFKKYWGATPSDYRRR